MAIDAPRPTRGAPSDELLELLQALRRELVLREESPSGEWVEATANDLRSGRQAGAYYPVADGGGLAFRTDRGTDAFAHVHVGPVTAPADRAAALARAIQADLPPAVRSFSLGLSGLTTSDETRVLEELSERPGSTVIRRYSLERRLTAEDGARPPEPPAGLRLVALEDVTIDALADLDFRAFRGSADAVLIGSNVGEYRRVLEALLAGRAGRYLREASAALYRGDPPALLGALVTCEKDPRHAAFLDFMIDPAAQGRGLGRYLLRWGFRALRALGYERVRLWVSESNAPARQLYESLGFATIQQTAIYRWDRPAGSPQPQTVT